MDRRESYKNATLKKLLLPCFSKAAGEFLLLNSFTAKGQPSFRSSSKSIEFI